MWEYKEEETANQRAWKRQQENPTPCRYGCGAKLVFLKDTIGRTIACEAKEFTFVQNGIPVMDKAGTITTTGRRVGWPVHACVKLQEMQQKALAEMGADEI